MLDYLVDYIHFNLRQMEKSGFINKKVYAEVLPKVEYSLTDLVR